LEPGPEPRWVVGIKNPHHKNDEGQSKMKTHTITYKTTYDQEYDLP
jgi:hypothetical protein